jgi:putative membrane protein
VTQDRPVRPRAFRLDAGQAVAADPHTGAPIRAMVEEQPDPYEREALEALAARSGPDEAAVQTAQKRGMAARALFSWGGLLWSSLGGLALFALAMWVTGFVEDLFARSPALGYVGLALAIAAGFALLALFTREARGILRQRHVARLHSGLADARAADDRPAARALVGELLSIYAARPETARARSHLSDVSREIVDGRDLVDIAERELMAPLDARVTREIAEAARRVSVVTAISPRAIVDLLFVAGQSVRLVRRIAEIYGGRPGSLGFLRILRSVATHLVITGGMAAGDSIVQQVLGHGIAARLSAKLGEGVLNGLLTARVGLSAMAVCRPMPFAAGDPPGLGEVAPFLFSRGKDEG